jgi:hypothetical protein
MPAFSKIVHQLQAQRELTQQELEKLNLAIKALTGFEGTVNLPLRRKPKFSKAGLARIAEAQRARWRKIKAAQKK